MHSHPAHRPTDDSLPHCPLCRAPVSPTAIPDLSVMSAILLAQMVPDFVHDFRTPLRNIQASVETLRDGAIDDPAARDQFLDAIDREVGRLDQIVRMLWIGQWASGPVEIPSQLAEAHRQVDAQFGVDWPVDLNGVADAAGRAAGGYSLLLGVVAYCILRTVSRVSSSHTTIAYALRADRLVGTATVSGVRSMDGPGWNMVRFVALASGATAVAQVADGGLTLRWEYPLV